MLVLDQKDVESLLTEADCVPIMEETLKQERSGGCTQYLRTALDLPNTNVLGLMPACFERGYFGVKVISVYHTNAGTGYPSHQGQILLFGREHGEVLAAVDAMSVTRLRTGAVSAAASRALARKDSRVLAILGCGAQGWSHLAAHAACFPLEEVRCWDMAPAAAQALAGEAERRGCRGRACGTAEEAAVGADIICTVTPSREPVLCGGWVKDGAHVNAVGACAPAARELDSALAARGRFFCDHRESILRESGAFLIPMGEGLFGEEHLLGALGDVLLGRAPGRTGPEEVTIFDAVGMAVEDIACAIWLYERHVNGRNG